MIEYTASQNDDRKKIINILKRLVPDCPQSLIYKSFRKKDIKVNGKHVDEKYIVKRGDKIKAFLPNDIEIKEKTNHDFFKASKKIDIIFEDENIIVCNKPAGLICHSDYKTFGDTLVDRIKRYLFETGQYNPDAEKTFTPALCNRLDRNTCGLVIAAKNAKTLKEINYAIKNKEINKYYYCLIYGSMINNQGVLKGYILRNEANNVSTVTKSETGNSKYIETEYRVIKQNKTSSLLEIKLITGRTHQIRAHLNSIGNPILGDKKYGNKMTDIFKYQALGAYKISFDFKSTYETINALNGTIIETDNLWFLNINKQ